MSTNKGFAQHPHEIFSEWYRATTPGQALKRLEFHYLSSGLKLTYNQITLQVGCPGDMPPLEGCPAGISCLVTTGPKTAHRAPAPVIAAPNEIPFGAQSIDVIYIVHVLEFSGDPYWILKECERILKPQGELHVIALNPWNPKNLPRCIPLLLKKTEISLITPSRLIAWLRSLHLETSLVAGFSLTPECCLPNSGSLLNRSRARLATAYAVRAIKRRQRLIPATPCWSSIPELIGGGCSIETAFLALDEEAPQA
ncbi:class I SAM-dependent methyltransferase [Methylococcus geothermalis]|uniref:Methyltransferase domain-containing protein n=1 Tax=Methylococcus geothermalis TaxID=2681310 RepID=A0A858Q7D5_9GAMM|nr:methyltransferase domain-containing protein [Methylococcus geothermalis]QJD29740.1 methyltransferase domain-containing protein [Methylococcus geothermalis]